MRAVSQFSEKTDVWSFGVTCWEIFEYGNAPYRGVKNAQVGGFLAEGARLQRPTTCPEDVYVHVQATWEELPGDRPRFSALASTFTKLVEDNGGVQQCRDIGSDLTGGRARAPSAMSAASAAPSARGGGGDGSSAAGRDRAATLARSSRIQSSSSAP